MKIKLLLTLLALGLYVYTFKFGMRVGYMIGRSDGYCIYSGKYKFEQCNPYYSSKELYE